MKTKWHIKDLIDLEYYLSIDADLSTQEPATNVDDRDRRIYLTHIQPTLTQTTPFPTRRVIKSWLDQRRKIDKAVSEATMPQPGETMAEMFRILQYGFFILGGLFGIGLAFSLLTYTGRAPLNVSVYVGVAVLIQIFLLMILGGLFLIRLVRPRLFYTSALYSILSRVASLMTEKLKRGVMRSLSGTKRQGLAAALGLVQGKKQIYGTLFYWPFFNAMQLFGIGLNLGILGTTLLRVAGTDMAFGWQSTVQVSASAVHTLVKWMASPWSWIVSADLAHPTLAQIEGSRLILKDGIYSLATPDLVAWWPFLCFAVLIYALFPRITLLIMGILTERHLLNRIPFTQAACDQLIDRLTLPRVRFEPSREPQPRPPDAIAPQETPPEILEPQTQKQYAVLIPDDIFDTCKTVDLKAVIEKQLGGQMKTKIRINHVDTDGPLSPDKLFAGKSFAGHDKNNQWTHLLLIQEAWQPPLIEDMAYFKSLRQHLGSRTPILIGLIGKPKPKTIFTEVSPVNRQTWQKQLASLGDPYLRLEELRL